MDKQAAYEAMVKQWHLNAEAGVKDSPEGFCEQLLEAALEAGGAGDPKSSAEQPQATHLDWLEDLVAEVLELMKERGAKYGPGNIAQFGDYGVMVRLSDKLSRLQTSLTHEFSDESVEDTWKDIINYGLIGLAWRRGLWPGSFKDPAKHVVNFDDSEFEQ